jgi:DNA-binding LytR/AlgR family response regulator
MAVRAARIGNPHRHRGIIVNISAIDTIYRSYRGSLEVKLKERSEILPVSAAHAHRFKSL